MMNLKKRGFTIVELVIVIAVIVILSAGLIPTFSHVIESANRSRVLQEARNKYTEVYAQDLSDGKLDKKEGEVGLTDEGYQVRGTVAIYTYFANGYTATFNGKEWSVSESASPTE